MDLRLRRNLTLTILLTLGAALAALVPSPFLSFPAAWLLITWLPGGQIVRWLGLYSSWREGRTLILSVVCGLLVSPVVVYWGSAAFGFSRLTAIGALIVLSVGLAALNHARPLAGRSPAPLCQTRRQYALFGVMMLVFCIGIVVPYLEPRTQAGVYPVEMADWFKHYGVSWSIRYTGVPPVDIFFYGNPARERLSYYYFFHLTAATLDILHGGESSIYLSLALLVLTAAASCVLTFYLLARRVLGGTGRALWSLLCMAFVGGLDVIPSLWRQSERLQPGSPGAGMPAWFPADHIDNWAPAVYLRLNTLYATFIWVPQHVVGLLAFGVGLYFFREVTHRRRLVAVAPVLLATLLGHSVWIAAIATACLVAYAAGLLISRWRRAGPRAALRSLAPYALVGALFLVVSAPLLREFASPAAPKSGIVFEIQPGSDYLSFFRLRLSDTAVTRLLDLLVQYVVELGALLVLGLGGLWAFTRQQMKSAGHPWREPLLPFFWLAVGLGFVTVSILASGRAWTSMGFTLNNDLGMRAIMPAQAILALFAGYGIDRLIRSGSRLKRPALAGAAILVTLGALAFGWEVCAMGIAKYLKPPRVDAATYRADQAMATLTEPMLVVKHRTHDNASSYQLMFGNRSPGFFTVEAAVFHPDLRQVAYAFGLTRFAYLNRLPAWSYQMFREMYADYAYVGAIDRTPDLYPEKFENPTYFEKIYAQDGIAIYRVRDLPLNRMRARFTPAGIRYMGYIVDEAPVYPSGFEQQSPKALVTAWQLEQPVAQDYTVYVHFVGPDGRVVGQADHQLWTWAKEAESATSGWESGRVYLDMIPLPPQVLGASVPLQIGIGLWVPQTGERLQAEPVDLSFDPDHRLVIGVFDPASQ